MDEPSVRALLARGERELSAGRRRSARALWAVAGAIVTVFAVSLATLIARTAPVGGPRGLLVGAAGTFGVLALYCWLRLLGSTR